MCWRQLPKAWPRRDCGVYIYTHTHTHTYYICTYIHVPTYIRIVRLCIRWAYYTFEVGKDWQTFEILCEAQNGVLVLQHGLGANPDDSESTLSSVSEERRIALLKAQAGVLEAQSRADEAAPVYAEIGRYTPPRAVTQIFPSRGQFLQVAVVSLKCSFDARANALVHSPAILHGEAFPGVWHVGLRGHGPRKQMKYKLGLRHSLRQVDQREGGRERERERERERVRVGG